MDKKDDLNIKVAKRKVFGHRIKSSSFFEKSNHFNGDIDLSEISDVAKQLKSLNYDDKYLLYVISFRAILEDIVKKYLYDRNIPMVGNFKENMIKMLVDMQDILKVTKTSTKKDEKKRILQKFKGYDAFNNFIAGINIKFNSENYDKFLHSLTHNPSKVDKDFALEIANDLILPLYVLSKLMKDENLFQ
ncbi:hypothetical protein [Jeotgalibacillus terrae]|uniref:Uncharacterized protein n=1 Tax=Jeotgalibacillus terrae TaxID=587735 RepID=A0ABW5ZFW4_9BACL|nr:hypothetical protein [Jeotgalibacillus terrae]MBM7580567.1 hypothetical protein [Jeotgalibacillus terrae]